MKIITGIVKKLFIKKIKLISLKIRYVLGKYKILRKYKNNYFVKDRRNEIHYNNILLMLNPNHCDQVLKIIK